MRPFIGSDGMRQYRIVVGKETYETVQLLSDLAADALVSRATRVWKVRRPGSDECHVLKDVWVEGHQQLEHLTYNMILRDIEASYGSEIRAQAASYLLTPVAYGLVNVNGEEDDTTRIMMRGYEPNPKQGFRFRVGEQDDVDANQCDHHKSAYDVGLTPTTRGLRAPFPRYVRNRKIHRRRHYRIVFKEVADALHTVRRLSDVFTVLRDNAKGVSRLYCYRQWELTRKKQFCSGSTEAAGSIET